MKDVSPTPGVAPRPPAHVMRLSQMGAMFPTRLSFLRSLTRRLGAEGARMERPVWAIDPDGFGHAVYTIAVGGHPYSLVAVSSHLPDDMRTDRVIATAWDTAYVLYDGIPDASEIARIAETAPKQEAARFTERDLILSRANRSVRLFSHVVERLRAGRQPDPDLVHSVGYLMRTTAVYGNGKFGIADRHLIEARPGLSGPFAAEMLTVWMIRSFTHDLVEHLGGAALAPDTKRHLGIGNATGLGMAPFLVSHPVLLHNWMMARETALARVCEQPVLDAPSRARLDTLWLRAEQHLGGWQVADAGYTQRLSQVRQEWPALREWLAELADTPFALAEITQRATALSADTQELALAWLLEPFGPLVDDLTETMMDLHGLCAPPFASIEALRGAIEDAFGWALGLDYDSAEQSRRFWYVSEEKAEPRLGDRYAEPGAEREAPLDIARRVKALHGALPQYETVDALLAAEPQHALAITRVIGAQAHPYSEIRDNLIAETTRPIDMLRCKLAFFGATRFDPKSDLWTRVTLAQGAPLPEDLGTARCDDWWLTVRPS